MTVVGPPNDGYLVGPAPTTTRAQRLDCSGQKPNDITKFLCGSEHVQLSETIKGYENAISQPVFCVLSIYGYRNFLFWTIPGWGTQCQVPERWDASCDAEFHQFHQFRQCQKCVMLLGDVDENLENSDKYPDSCWWWFQWLNYDDCDLGFFLAYAYCMLLLIMDSWKAIARSQKYQSPEKNSGRLSTDRVSPGSKTLGKAGQIGRWLPQCHVNRQVSGLPNQRREPPKVQKSVRFSFFSRNWFQCG